MKYQKPISRELSNISFAGGVCMSGIAVGNCDPNGGLAGYCRANGWTAGSENCITNGNIAADTCASNGPAGVGYHCLNGFYASEAT